MRIYQHYSEVAYKECGAYFSFFFLLLASSTLSSFFVCVREMGNCQAIDAATLVVQHPSGKVDTFYWPVSANEIMKMNPGHYVALLISTTLCQTSDKENCPVKNEHNNNNNNSNSNQVRLTRIKLLRPTDTLVLGQVYRLITTQGLCFVLVFFPFTCDKKTLF